MPCKTAARTSTPFCLPSSQENIGVGIDGSEREGRPLLGHVEIRHSESKRDYDTQLRRSFSVVNKGVIKPPCFCLRIPLTLEANAAYICVLRTMT
jgi:hypothetical protein